MVRWQLCLLLAMLLLLPARSRSKMDDDDEEERNEEDDEDEEGEDEEEEDVEQAEKSDMGPGRRAPAILPTPKTVPVSRTTPKRALECYVCTYKSETPLKACLDPTKYRVHTITCHSVDDKCFTSVISKGNIYEAVIRGCRSGCLGSPETTCCELNRCNNQALALPVISPHGLKDKSSKSIPPTVFFFVTVLLLVQTVGKVAFV
ncbi:glycosylphosphatidylinositol-anchored high density lipoprotein-binding protein 1-like [Battus philenor]|uniref:glycosylphosphatidylinositol-anchored high density lipoprotein-binding protein 1-like n=1 Tax=Battus philenor TaxID=42288 RepID=UPI0035CFBDB8